MKFDSSLENKPVIVLSNNDGCAISRSNQAKVLENIFLPSYKYKKAGVMLMDITSNSYLQLNFRDKVDREKHKRLMEVLDRTNENMAGTL